MEFLVELRLENNMPHRAFSIHAHFYQPPREDPLSGLIPIESSAAPYPNWNERIYAECYRPNAELRNFEQISFNIGPTLFAWLQTHHPQTCQKIVEQDRANMRRYGVGNAIAQAYNHSILPLASYRDKLTQVYWGIADFEYRFGRKPLGMWLPETAVDEESLAVLARLGIDFTILAPWQAAEDDIDPTEPYTVTLSPGEEVTVFFYERELSARVSFDPQATLNADVFAECILLSRFNLEKSRKNEAQLLLVASDGELYGHHQKFRERFLSRLVDGASSQFGMQPTYPALWLREHPPKRSVAIRERTSWSCHHGIARWMESCDCIAGDGSWKTGLRDALERLAGQLDDLYAETVRPWAQDPWLLRDRYIHVLLGQITLPELLVEMGGRAPTSEALRRIHLVLESQRERQRMFTSCGWFFDDFDRIEPRNNLRFAAQAVHLARLATGVDLSADVSRDISLVISAQSGLSVEQVFSGYLHAAGGAHSPLSDFVT